MDTCIRSLLKCGQDIQIVIVNDGSTKDNTAQKADEWASKYPAIISAIHKENGGHGSAVNTGLEHARGLYFKVVDSDDWLDEYAMTRVMPYLREQACRQNPTDLLIANYVYEKIYKDDRKIMRSRREFPVGREFDWSQIKLIVPGKYLHMHSTIYRTQLLVDINLKLPEHCYYVDNLYVYKPLPYVKSVFYLDVDMYRYFIGRAGQSVSESAMIQRIDQHILVTREMIGVENFPDMKLNRRLYKYMANHLAMMICVCAVYLRMNNNPEEEKKLADIWDYLHYTNPMLFKRVKRNILVVGTNIPGKIGRLIGQFGYRIAQHLVKFN